jgi:hypothetical protein
VAGPGIGLSMAPTQVIIDVFFNELIDGCPPLWDASSNLPSVDEVIVRKYRITIALIALLLKLQSDERFEAVLQEFESKLFDRDPTSDGVAELINIKKRMGQINGLLDVDSENHAGALLLFATEGLRIDLAEVNPVILARIEQYFFTCFSAAINSLEIAATDIPSA